MTYYDSDIHIELNTLGDLFIEFNPLHLTNWMTIVALEYNAKIQRTLTVFTEYFGVVDFQYSGSDTERVGEMVDLYKE